MKLSFTHRATRKGKTHVTCGAIRAGDGTGTLDADTLQRLLQRHTSGDWGDVPPHIHQTNRYALEYHHSLLSCYFHPADGIRMVVIHTLADRRETVITVHA
jgi:hypothetical protein